jgi:predicted RNase H-like HicB family nuclease
MAIRYYPAIIERSADGFFASFPDVPGCVAHARTSEDLAAVAESVLAMHLAGLAEDGEPIPEPSHVEDVPRDPEVSEVARLLVRAELPGKAVRVNISIEEGLLASLDAEVKRRQTTRSGFLAAAVRRELAQGAR